MQVAVLDACVLYSAPLRDFFMHLAVALYQPKWTDEIHEEWIENLLADRPDLSRSQLDRTRTLMNRYGGDCLVTQYKKLIPGLVLPDPDDRHVLAAAIAAKASVLVTFNLSDFPQATLLPLGIRALHPDEFAAELYDLDTQQFIALLKSQRLELQSPPKDVEQFLSTLEGCGLKNTAAKLRGHSEEL